MLDMFRRGRGGHLRGPAQPTVLTQFKAGKLTTTPVPEAQDGRLSVVADPRRGLIVVERGVDGATRFLWKDRATTRTVDEIFIVAGDQYVNKVETGNDKDRVYVFGFHSTDERRFLFWMQDSDASKDAKSIADLSSILSQVPAAPAERGGAARSGGASAVAAAPVISRSALDDIFDQMGYAAPEGGAPAAPAAASTSSDLSRALNAAAAAANRTPALDVVVTSAAMDELLSDPAFRASLLPLLPAGRQTEAELDSTIRSPQLRQAMRALSVAMQAGEYNNVVANFGLNPNAGAAELARGDAVGAFLAALQASVSGAASADASAAAATEDVEMADSEKPEQNEQGGGGGPSSG